ncbi:MAG: hypothetical protein GX208_04545 [Firmicutes bacterium]|nr:hypothetical protein [Bacillota bacterium]
MFVQAQNIINAINIDKFIKSDDVNALLLLIDDLITSIGFDEVNNGYKSHDSSNRF